MTSINITDWRARGKRMELLGRRIFVVDEGAPLTPALLLIHGFPTASWDWVKIWPQLVKTHRVVAFDLLGFGYSEKPKQHTYSIHEQADLTEALVDRLKLDNFHVLAHDYGDTVAQELLARQNAGTGSGNWLSLMLLNGGLFPETHQARLIQKLLLSPVGAIITRLISKRSFAKSFAKIWGANTQPDSAEIDAFWSLACHNQGNLLMHKLIHYISDRIQHRDRWVQALREANVPIGLINGSVDPVSGAHMVTRFRELIGTHHFVEELTAIGHYPQVEAPDATLNAYERFRQAHLSVAVSSNA